MLDEGVNRNVRLLVGFQIRETLCKWMCAVIQKQERGEAHLGKEVEIEGVWMIKVVLVFKGQFEFFWAMWLVETVLKWKGKWRWERVRE